MGKLGRPLFTSYKLIAHRLFHGRCSKLDLAQSLLLGESHLLMINTALAFHVNMSVSASFRQSCSEARLEDHWPQELGRSESGTVELGIHPGQWEQLK